jgi:hypothetical protein
MSLIEYPTEDYNSWVTEDQADEYFEDRLNADPWDTANKEAALITAFRSLNGLGLTIDPTEAEELEALQQAQCEQALHEIINDLDSPNLSRMSLGGMLSVNLPDTPPPRYSERALSILRPYLTARTVARTR